MDDDSGDFMEHICRSSIGSPRSKSLPPLTMITILRPLVKTPAHPALFLCLKGPTFDRIFGYRHCFVGGVASVGSGARMQRLQADCLDLCRRLKELRVSFDRQRQGENPNDAYGPAASLLPRKMRLFVVTELKVLPASKRGHVRVWCTWDEVEIPFSRSGSEG